MMLLVVLAAGTFAGCPLDKSAQKSWVREMNRVFKDDHFEYQGAVKGEYGSSRLEANVSSEKFPDEQIHAKKEDGQILTDYNYFRLKDNAGAYYEDYFSSNLDDLCDNYEVEYVGYGFTPIKDITVDEYIDEYGSCMLEIYIYDATADFPAEEDTVNFLIDAARSLGSQCHIRVWYCTKQAEAVEDRGWYVNYTLEMSSADHIDHIDARSSGGSQPRHIVDSMDI